MFVPDLTQDNPQVCAFLPILSSCRHYQRNTHPLDLCASYISKAIHTSGSNISVLAFFMTSILQSPILWKIFHILHKSHEVLLDTVRVWRVRVHCGLSAILNALLNLLLIAVDVCFIPAHKHMHSSIHLCFIAMNGVCYSFPASMLTGLVVSIWWNIFLA